MGGLELSPSQTVHNLFEQASVSSPVTWAELEPTLGGAKVWQDVAPDGRARKGFGG